MTTDDEKDAGGPWGEVYLDPSNAGPDEPCAHAQWSTASDGLGDVTAVAAVCVACGYTTTSAVDARCTTPPASSTSEADHA